MHLQYSQTKEMIIGNIQKILPTLLCVYGNVIDTAKCFKEYLRRLALYAHVDALCAEVATKLCFSKIIKRSGLPQKDSLCFCTSVVRSVVQYSCVVWHHNLTTAQSNRLKALEKRPLRIMMHPMTLPLPRLLGY